MHEAWDARIRAGHEPGGFKIDSIPNDRLWEQQHYIRNPPAHLVDRACDFSEYGAEVDSDGPVTVYLTMPAEVRAWMQTNIRGDWDWGFVPETYLVFRDPKDAARFRAFIEAGCADL